MYIIGPQPLASVFVNPATPETEIFVLKGRGRHRYNCHCSRAGFVGDECRDVHSVCFQIPVELRIAIGACESTAFGGSKRMLFGRLGRTEITVGCG